MLKNIGVLAELLIIWLLYCWKSIRKAIISKICYAIDIFVRSISVPYDMILSLIFVSMYFMAFVQ